MTTKAVSGKAMENKQENLKIPGFMKKKETAWRPPQDKPSHPKQVSNLEVVGELVYLDEEDLYDDVMPVEPRISPIQADIHEVTVENSMGEDKSVVAPLTEAEKGALREYIHGMDRRQMEIVLEEIPMDLIISHFSKKWTEAEIFRQNIAMAMGR